jgi:ribosomal protein L37AE/L43A
MSNADWYARKLGNQPVRQVAQQAPPLIPQSQMPLPAMPQFQPSPVPSQAQSAQQVERCPECGSENYMRPTPQIALRCYDCGYPIEQSGSRYGSLAGAKVEGAAKQSRGNDGTSNWNPQGIIGRIDG